jgi:hypothetical protein
MAGPVTHIVLALHILHLLPGHIDKEAFIVGTSFPDIRYMAELTREQTHIEPVSWQDVINEPSSFRAGMLFHNLVDEIRITDFEGDFYDRSKAAQYNPLYLKLFLLIHKAAEDAYLYTKVSGWEEIAGYFDTIYQEERDFQVSEEILREWHTMIQRYIAHPTNTDLIAQFVANNCDIYKDISTFDPNAYFHVFTRCPVLQEKLQIFYDNFISYALQYNTPNS